jgi:hypothetical protein
MKLRIFRTGTIVALGRPGREIIVPEAKLGPFGFTRSGRLLIAFAGPFGFIMVTDRYQSRRQFNTK